MNPVIYNGLLVSYPPLGIVGVFTLSRGPYGAFEEKLIWFHIKVLISLESLL